MTELCEAQQSDFDGFYRLRCQEKNIAWTGHTEAPSYENLQRWYDAQLKSPTRTIYLLKADGLVAGYLYADRHDADTMEIGYGVDEDLNGRGLGSDMIGTFVDIAKSQGISHVFALVAETNLASQKCLARNGFSVRSFGDVRELPSFGMSVDFYKWQFDL